jgi:hypothetical protein
MTAAIVLARGSTGQQLGVGRDWAVLLSRVNGSLGSATLFFRDDGV